MVGGGAGAGAAPESHEGVVLVVAVRATTPVMSAMKVPAWSGIRNVRARGSGDVDAGRSAVDEAKAVDAVVPRAMSAVSSVSAVRAVGEDAVRAVDVGAPRAEAAVRDADVVRLVGHLGADEEGTRL